MSVEDLHGFFHFSDDCFKDTPRGKGTTPAADYAALEVYDQWYAHSGPVLGFDQIQLDYFHATHLYSQGQYQECIGLIQSILPRLDKHNHLERELLETIGRCACKVDDQELALDAVGKLDLHHRVEEPGLLVFKCHTYLHFGLLAEGVKSGEEYLRLRPGDISVHMLIADACRQVCVDTAIKHYGHARQCLLSHRRSERDPHDEVLERIAKSLSDIQPGCCS